MWLYVIIAGIGVYEIRTLQLPMSLIKVGRTSYTSINMNPENLNKLITEAIAIEAEAAKEAGAVGYMARVLTQATLPHKKVIGNEFTRKNGDFSLSVLSPSDVGLPYGSIPRLLIAWISTEAVLTQNKKLYLGKSLADFMRKLDLCNAGGKRGDITRLKDQMRRLFSAAISYSYENHASEGRDNFYLTKKYRLWWNPKNPNDVQWESYIELDDTFFKELISNPVPIDIRALKNLKKSPLALDIYCWLTYRMCYLKKMTRIPWALLQVQFGANYQLNLQGKRHFKYEFIKELRKVKLFYQAVNMETDPNNLILIPSKPHIPKLKVQCE